MPVHVIGQLAQHDVRPNPIGRTVAYRAHRQVDTFETPERLLYQGQPLLRPHPIISLQRLTGSLVLITQIPSRPVASGSNGLVKVVFYVIGDIQFLGQGDVVPESGLSELEAGR
jgi:hypothetical protein